MSVPRPRPLVRRLVPVLLALIVAAADPPRPLPARAGSSNGGSPSAFSRNWSSRPIRPTRIEEVFKASWPELQAAKRDLDQLETELSRLIAEGTASEAKVLQQIDRVEASRSAMGRSRSLMLYRMHRLLSPDQRVKLKVLYEAVEREKAQRPHESVRP